jgi:hypothetical protein
VLSLLTLKFVCLTYVNYASEMASGKDGVADFRQKGVGMRANIPRHLVNTHEIKIERCRVS